MRKSRTQICRKCGREYKGTPALSRENWMIMICPDCAAEERRQEEAENMEKCAHQTNTKA